MHIQSSGATTTRRSFFALGESGGNAPTRSGGSAGPRLKATLSGNGQTHSLYYVLLYSVHDVGTCSGTAGLRRWVESLWLAQSPVRSEVSLIDNVADDGNASLDVGKPVKLKKLAGRRI